jgi:hypothetical protein
MIAMEKTRCSRNIKEGSYVINRLRTIYDINVVNNLHFERLSDTCTCHKYKQKHAHFSAVSLLTVNFAYSRTHSVTARQCSIHSKDYLTQPRIRKRSRLVTEVKIRKKESRTCKNSVSSNLEKSEKSGTI